jgi:hypothetical protein
MFRARDSGEKTSADQSAGLVWKIAGGVIIGLLAVNMIGNAVDNYRQSKAMEMFAQEMKRIAADPDPLGWRAAAAARQGASRQAATTIPQSRPVTRERHMPPAPRAQTAAEIRESQRKADEAMKVLEPNVPEM